MLRKEGLYCVIDMLPFISSDSTYRVIISVNEQMLYIVSAAKVESNCAAYLQMRK